MGKIFLIFVMIEEECGEWIILKQIFQIYKKR